MSWQGKILRVNLSRGTCAAEPLNREWAEDYLGQRGLASRYLAAEMDPKADALAPANKLIFATGPLTGTAASTGGRYSVITKGALTNAIACSNCGGFFGAELKMAGWDMVIVEGRAKKPVYLLTPGVEVNDIVNITAMAVFESQSRPVAVHGKDNGGQGRETLKEVAAR